MARLKYQNKKRAGKTYDYARLLVRIDGKEKPINIGASTTKRHKERDRSFKKTVSELEAIKASGEKLDSEMRLKLGKIKESYPNFYERLKSNGLFTQTNRDMTVKELFDLHCQRSHKVDKDRTVRNYRQAQQVFEDYVGSEAKIRTITEGDWEDFLKYCKRDDDGNKSKQDSTIRNYGKRTRSAFAYAVKKGWIIENPIPVPPKAKGTTKSKDKTLIQQEWFDNGNLDHLLSQNHTFEFELLLQIVRWTGCRIAEVLILRWEDVSFDPSDPTISFRSKDTQHNYDRDKMPVRVSPLWDELRPYLEKAKSLNPDEKYVVNNILRLREKPEFEQTNHKGEVIRRGRYETNANSALTKAINRAGLPSKHIGWHSIRDYRINELDRSGCRVSELDEWIGNTDEVRKRHYRTNSVNSTDRETARLRGSESRCTKNSEAVYHIVSKDHAQTDPNQLIQQLSKSVKGRELLEMLEKALKQSDPADLEEDAKYTRRDSNPQPSVPKTDALSS